MNKHEKTKSNKNNIKKIYGLIPLFFIAIMIISGLKIIEWFKDSNNNNKLIKEISEEIIIDNEIENDNVDKYSVNFGELTIKNPDTIGWLKVNGTQIQYPVVKGKDNSYYLTHSFDNSYNKAGCLFADYRNKIDETDKNIIIYGHNRKDGTMFGSLREILNEEWYNNKENRKIMFFTQNEKSIYEVFSVYRVKKEDYYIQTAFTDSSYSKFLEIIKNRSIKDFEVDITSKDKILTLSTCDNNSTYRIVLHAKKTF